MTRLSGSTNAERLALHVARMSNGCLEWQQGRFPKGYGALVDLETGKVRSTHRMAWEQAHGPIPPGKMVCHHCDNPPCCDPEHLFLGTGVDNQRDMVEKGRKHLIPAEQHARGSAHGMAKLDERQVVEILRRLDEGRHGIQTMLAREFDVSISVINRIKMRRTWRHVEP